MSNETSNFLAGKAASMAGANPAERAATANPERRRIPMSLPTLKLQVPEIPGYKCRWMRGTTGRLQQALAGGYEFVERDEVALNAMGLADAALSDGNSDLGSRVSISAGEEMAEGQGVRLYLMKIKRELWDEDQRMVDAQHEAIAAQLRGDKGIQGEGDNTNRYSKPENRNIFQPRRPT